MATRKKANGKSIAADMHSLKAAFDALGVRPNEGEELAFHLGDLKDEIIEVGRILARVCKYKRCTTAQLRRLQDILVVHWLYHLRKLDRLLRRNNIIHTRGRRGTTFHGVWGRAHKQIGARVADLAVVPPSGKPKAKK